MFLEYGWTLRNGIEITVGPFIPNPPIARTKSRGRGSSNTRDRTTLLANSRVDELRVREIAA